MKMLKRVLGILDRWQQRNRILGVSYGVIRKFADDDANLLVVALGWYGFTAIYPLLLVVVTVFGYIGVASLGHSVVATLHQFPVIGAEFNPARGASNLHGSLFALVVGVLGLLYGAQGVTQTAQQAMARVWNTPPVELPSFLRRLLRSLSGLAIIGTAFIVNAFVDALITGHGHGPLLRVVLLRRRTQPGRRTRPVAQSAPNPTTDRCGQRSSPRPHKLGTPPTRLAEEDLSPRQRLLRGVLPDRHRGRTVGHPA